MSLLLAKINLLLQWPLIIVEKWRCIHIVYSMAYGSEWATKEKIHTIYIPFFVSSFHFLMVAGLGSAQTTTTKPQNKHNSNEKYHVTNSAVYDGEVLPLTKVSRNEMGAYLCIATNGVPPSVSKRIILDVECKCFT